MQSLPIAGSHDRDEKLNSRMRKKITLKRYENLNFTPALPLAVDGWKYLLDNKLCRNTIMVFWDNWAIVAFSGKIPIGVLTFAKSDWQRELYINIGYVLEPWREKGIYRLLWDEIVKWGKELKLACVNGSTAASNEHMRAVAKKLGRREDGVSLRYDL